MPAGSDQTSRRFIFKAQVTDAVASSLEWEPPGGTHPGTWRALYGGKFVYRKVKPGTDVSSEDEGKLFTPKEKKKLEQQAGKSGKPMDAQAELLTLRDEFLRMTPSQHRKEAKNPSNDKRKREFHLVEAKKKDELKGFLSMLEGHTQDLKKPGTKPESASSEKDPDGA